MNTWQIQEKEWDISQYEKYETLFALSNGSLGVRGSFEEDGLNCGHDGFYMNGFYETYPLSYGETFPGYPATSQAMVNLPNPKRLKLSIDGNPFSLLENPPLEYERTLDMKSAILSRNLIYQTGSGKKVRIQSERFVSAVHKNLFCLRYKMTALEDNCLIGLSSGYDLDSHNLSKNEDPRVGVEFTDPPVCRLKCHESVGKLSLRGEIHHSGLKFSSTIVHKLDSMDLSKREALENNSFSGETWHFNLDAGKTAVLDKFVIYEKGNSETAPSLYDYNSLKEEHSAWWQNAWKSMDVSISGDKAMQQGIRFNMFHLLQSAGKDGKTNISAKGMTGEGYEGHYFWDTEIYMIPFFTFTNPAIARSLLDYRHSILDAARARALEMGHKQGALFPWRTISGPECSSYFPEGTAQYHISSDVAHAVKVYWEGTEDEEYLLTKGLDLLVETNRLWADMAVYNSDSDSYAIQNVTGPDEYTALVDNNFYTNRMIKDQLSFFMGLLKEYRERPHDDLFKILFLKKLNELKVQENELKLWGKISDKILLLYDKKSGIIPQDDRFLQKPLWNIKETPPSDFPLLMHYHPLILYRYQVCKQPDVVLAEFLLSEDFSIEQKIRDYDYYEKITTHDSSLSPCIYGCMASDIGRIEESYKYYVKTAHTDLNDFHGNVKDGVHAANMAGSWIGLTYGFARMRHKGGKLSFSPLLPPDWESYSFSIHKGDAVLTIQTGPEDTGYQLIKGDSLLISHYGKECIVTKEYQKLENK